MFQLQIPAPQQRHQPAFRSATTYHYSSAAAASPPLLATTATGGTAADANLALPNTFDWQQRQRQNLGFQGGTHQ